MIKPVIAPVIAPTVDPIAAAGGLPWESRGGGAPTPILAFADGTMVRAGEASRYTAMPNTTGSFLTWSATNTLREDKRDGTSGLYLFEQARTNLALYSENLSHATWTKTGATISGTTATAPDGEADCHTVDYTASATDEVSQAISGTADGTGYYTSCWVRAVTGTGNVRIQYTLRDGTTPVTSDIPITTTWTRISDRRSWGTGVTTPTIAIRNGSGAAAQSVEVWGAQVEADASTLLTSYIRTTTVSVTRATDVFSFTSVPAALRSGKFRIDVSPTGANTTGIYVLAFAAAANDRLLLTTATPGASMQVAAVSQYSRGSALTYAADSVMRLTCDQAGAVLTVSGATTGDGTGSAGTPVSYADGYLSVGSRNGIGALAVRIGEPYAA